MANPRFFTEHSSTYSANAATLPSEEKKSSASTTYSEAFNTYSRVFQCVASNLDPRPDQMYASCRDGATRQSCPK